MDSAPTIAAVQPERCVSRQVRNHASNSGSSMHLHQGDCVHLSCDPSVYQVIAIDEHHDRCWVRRWPLERHGSPVFEVSLASIDFRDAALPAA